MDTVCKFSIGKIIHHLRFDYRGVIIDVDADFQGSEEWYREMAKSKPPRNKPWYHVLVDKSNTMTYVAEQNLEEELSPQAHSASAGRGVFQPFRRRFLPYRFLLSTIRRLLFSSRTFCILDNKLSPLQYRFVFPVLFR